MAPACRALFQTSKGKAWIERLNEGAQPKPADAWPEEDRQLWAPGYKRKAS